MSDFRLKPADVFDYSVYLLYRGVGWALAMFAFALGVWSGSIQLAGWDTYCSVVTVVWRWRTSESLFPIGLAKR